MRGLTYGMKVQISVDKDFSLIHSFDTISANVHDITRVANYCMARRKLSTAMLANQGIEKHAEIDGKSTTFLVATRTGMRRVLQDTPEVRLLVL
jgi:hypothetical protein